ncbi:hypothetical protein EXS71_02335 [Candidatus Uhrbacteria bacterium]|nr:hypothetical protein [Candidatus Uhrbacteria bacterium]
MRLMLKYLYQNSCLLSKSEVSQTIKKLTPSLGRVKEMLPLKLAFDQKAIRQIANLASKKTNKRLKYVVVVGIGGPNLGSKSIYDALYGSFDRFEPKRFPKIFYADTADSEALSALLSFIKKEVHDPEEILLNIISKSGTTTESIVNAEMILRALKKTWMDRVVVSTDHGSKLWMWAKRLQLDILTIPEAVGGRYSMFSCFGLFPLAAIGCDIKSLCAGARAVDSRAAMHSAAVSFLELKKGKTIQDHFFFHPELETVGKWVRQLIAESLGKDGKGLTPTVSIGSNDLHAVGQLYFGGPQDKFFTFVSSEKNVREVKLPRRLMLNGIVDGLAGRSASEIMQAILQGTKMAYKKAGMPFCEIVLPDLSLHSLGAFAQFKMMETIFMGELLQVNAFDQPAVELYKKETRRILAQ